MSEPIEVLAKLIVENQKLRDEVERLKWDYEELRKDYLKMEGDLLELRPNYWREKAQEQAIATCNAPNALFNLINKTRAKKKAEEDFAAAVERQAERDRMERDDG